jgi:hypothetical protein
MSSSRHDRFLKLERPRQAGGEAPDPLPDDDRFERIGDPAARPDPFPERSVPSPSPVPSTSTDRFRPPPERPLETADARQGAQPFTRCASCQMDNTIYAAACQNCGAALDTPAQQDFNQRLWNGRQAEAEAERRATAEREQARQRDAAEQARLRRELAEQMARQERDRIDEELGDGPAGRAGASDTAGMRLLRLVPGAGLRISIAVLAIGIPLLLLVFGRGQVQFAGMALLGVLIALFSPARRRTRRW